MARWKTILFFSSSIFIVLCVAFSIPYLLGSIFTSGDIPHKTDAEMIANFQAHKAEFIQLVEMIQKDKGLFRVDYYWASPEDPLKIGVSKARLDEYRAIFRTIGVPRGFYNYQETGTMN